MKRNKSFTHKAGLIACEMRATTVRVQMQEVRDESTR